MHKELEVLAGIEVPSMQNFWTWVRNAFTEPYQHEIEDYLAQSVDHCDLEYRMKVLQKRGMVC